MSCKFFLFGSCTAIVLTTLCGGNAFAGFTEPGDTKQIPLASVAMQDAMASADDESAGQMLTFDVKGDDPTANEQMETQSPAPSDAREMKEPVAAPLPNALLPGGVMLAGCFLTTKILKRRLA